VNSPSPDPSGRGYPHPIGCIQRYHAVGGPIKKDLAKNTVFPPDMWQVVIIAIVPPLLPLPSPPLPAMRQIPSSLGASSSSSSPPLPPHRCHCCICDDHCRRTVAVESGAPEGVPLLLMLSSFSSRNVFDPNGSRPRQLPSFWRWQRNRATPPVRFNLATYRHIPAVCRSRLITMAIAPLSSLSSPPPLLPPRASTVAAVVSIALWMNPSTFLLPVDRCAISGGPPSGILQGALSPPPLLPPPPPRRRQR